MSDYVRPRKYGGESKIIESLKRLEKSINVETSKGDNALFKRSIIIQTGKVTINADDLDMEFDVEFDDDTETNESEITVYNLSDTTIQNIKKGEKLTLTAGYKEDTGIILSGFISQVKTSFDDLDKVTIIKVVDSAGGAEREIKDLAFAKGVFTKEAECIKMQFKEILSIKMGLP